MRPEPCGAGGAVGRLPWVQDRPGGCFLTSVLPHLPPFPDGFPLAATRAVTHAVKILPSPGNYKQKMRLDSRAPPGTGGCRTDSPGKGLGRAPGPGREGLGAHRAPPHREGHPGPTPGPGAFGEAKGTVAWAQERGGGRGCSSGASSPGVTWGWKSLTHTHGNPPGTGSRN